MDQPWIPALRFAAAGMTVLNAGCGADTQDACNDNGGVWDGGAERCYCSYNHQGAYTENPSDDQIAWREWCANLTDLNSIKTKAAATPAPTGD
ncbi:MAG: hypothetical protein AAFR65_13580 [Pseudomonadota bacterium]